MVNQVRPPTSAWHEKEPLFTLRKNLGCNFIWKISRLGTRISRVHFLYVERRDFFVSNKHLQYYPIKLNININIVSLWICLNGVNTVMMSIMQPREYHVFPSWYHEIFQFWRLYKVIWGRLIIIWRPFCGCSGFWIIILIIWRWHGSF